MLDQVALDPRREDVARYRRAADGWFSESKCSAYVPEQPAGILLGRRCVESPERMDVVDGDEDAAVADGKQRREVGRRDPSKQCLSRGGYMLLGSLLRRTDPRGTQLRPPELPQRAQRMGRPKKGSLPHVPTVVFYDEAHGIDRQRSAERDDRLQLIGSSLALDLG